jgi:hypothetical protein
MQALCHIYIINVGQGFMLLWSIVKLFLDPKIAAMIHVIFFIISAFFLFYGWVLLFWVL